MQLCRAHATTIRKVMDVILYTTAGCHLCNLANELLLAIPPHYKLQIIATEIGDDDDLVDRYGIRIPVVQFTDGSEIAWPFKQVDIETKLTQL